jgi:sigma-E factor negative regulatory protein RseC
MEQVGFVKNISNGKAEVEVKRISGCGGGCKSCGGCDTPSHTVFIKNNINAEVGDTVEIKGETKNILKYTLIVYMIPFAMLIIGITLGMKVLKSLEVSNQELLSFLIGLVFLALGYFIVKIFDKKIEKEDDSTITMTRII